MKFLYFSIVALFIISGCASSSNNQEKMPKDYPNLVTLQKAQDVSHQPAKIYVDSVKQITANDHPALLISGSFPDGCTHLSNVTHQIDGGILILEFSAWRNTDKMCAQVLTPFSFIYEQLEDQEITSRSEVFINDTGYSY